MGCGSQEFFLIFEIIFQGVFKTHWFLNFPTQKVTEFYFWESVDIIIRHRKKHFFLFGIWFFGCLEKTNHKDSILCKSANVNRTELFHSNSCLQTHIGLFYIIISGLYQYRLIMSDYIVNILRKPWRIFN